MSLWKEIWLPQRNAHFMLNAIGILAVGLLKKNTELLRRKHKLAAKNYFSDGKLLSQRNSKLKRDINMLNQPLELYNAVRVKGKITQKFLAVRKLPEMSVYFNVIDRLLDKKIPFHPINAFKSVMGLLPIKYSTALPHFNEDNRIKIGWEWFWISRQKLNMSLAVASSKTFRSWRKRRLWRKLKWWRKLRRRGRFFRWKFYKRCYWRVIGKRYLYNLTGLKGSRGSASYSLKPSYNFDLKYLKQAEFDYSYYFTVVRFDYLRIFFKFNFVKPFIFSKFSQVAPKRLSGNREGSAGLLFWKGVTFNFIVNNPTTNFGADKQLVNCDHFSYNNVFTLKRFFNYNAMDLATTEPIFIRKNTTYGIKFSDYFEAKFNFFYYFIFNFLKAINSRNIYFQFTSDIESHFSRIFLTRRYIWYLGWWWWYDIFKHVMDPERAVDVYYIAVLTKDVFIYKAFLKRLLERKHLKLHKKIFKFMILITEYYYSECYKEAGICGVRLELKGKISRTGNLRKVKMFRKVLQSSTSNYNYKTRHLFFPVRTKTGALGCRIWFYYR